MKAMRYLYLILLITVLCPFVYGATRGGSRVKPSENAGRLGQYTVPSKAVKGYSYHVYVPDAYESRKAAGIHLFLHGQNACANDFLFGKKKFRPFLEDQLLIGVQPQFPDGDNLQNTRGKVAVAEEAIAQIQADYNIIIGRGVICSFSGGGIPHGILYTQNARKKTPDAEWPFLHMNLYDTCFRVKAGDNMGMSWFIGVGENEWDLKGSGLGKSQVARMEDLMQAFRGRGTPDVYLKITKGKAHMISDEDAIDAAAQFKRVALARAPFLYPGNWPQRELQMIVANANELQLQLARTGLERLLAKGGIAPDVQEAAKELQARIAERVKTVMNVSRGLAENDAVMAQYYIPIYQQQLKGSSEEKELSELLMATRKKWPQAQSAYEEFAKKFGLCFGDGSQPKLNPKAVPMLEKLRDATGPASQPGKMASEFLLMQ